MKLQRGGETNRAVSRIKRGERQRSVAYQKGAHVVRETTAQCRFSKGGARELVRVVDFHHTWDMRDTGATREGREGRGRQAGHKGTSNTGTFVCS